MSIIFRIYYTTETGNVGFQDHTTISEALQAAEHYRKVRCRFVTMVSENTELVGKPGVSGVKDGKLPTGENYTYTKEDALSMRKKEYRTTISEKGYSDIISDGGYDPRN